MNSVTGLFETLVAAAPGSAANAIPKFANSMVDCVFYGWGAQNTGAIGETVNITIPTVSEGDVNDIGSGDIQITDTGQSNVTLTINRKFNTSFVVKNFDQVRTPKALREMFLDARMEAVLRKYDRALCNLVNTTNFTTNATITGGADVFTRSHLSSGWRNLVDAGAPVGDNGNLFFLTHHTPYANMLNDSSLVQQSIVGDRAADTTRNGVFLPHFGAELKYDQLFPVPSAGAYAGLFFHRYAFAVRAVTEPSQADGSIKETIVYPRPNLPVKIQMANSIEKQGMIVTLSIVCGMAVPRESYGAYMLSG
jgi:hypothetical protein